MGLDMHKESIVVALAEAGKRNELREHCKIAHTSGAVKALVAKLARIDHRLASSIESSSSLSAKSAT
jgi:hypothetical protein